MSDWSCLVRLVAVEVLSKPAISANFATFAHFFRTVSTRCNSSLALQASLLPKQQRRLLDRSSPCRVSFVPDRVRSVCARLFHCCSCRVSWRTSVCPLQSLLASQLEAYRCSCTLCSNDMNLASYKRCAITVIKLCSSSNLHPLRSSAAKIYHSDHYPPGKSSSVRDDTHLTRVAQKSHSRRPSQTDRVGPAPSATISRETRTFHPLVRAVDSWV